MIRNALTTQVRLAWVKWRSRWIDGSATFTIVVSRTIISCARQTTARAIQRRRSPAGAVREDDVIGVNLLRRRGEPVLKWRPPPLRNGGSLRNYTEAPSGLSRASDDLPAERPDSAATCPSAPDAGRRAAQLREADRRCARRVRRGRCRDLARGDRAPRRGRDRHALSALPDPPGPARGRLRRRGRGALPVRGADLAELPPWEALSGWLAPISSPTWPPSARSPSSCSSTSTATRASSPAAAARSSPPASRSSSARRTRE